MDTTFFDSVSARVSHLNGVYSSKVESLDKLKEETDGLKTNEELLAKTEAVLKHLIDVLAKNDLKKMDRLISYGLNTVYPDRDIKFESSVEESRGKLRMALRTINDGNIVAGRSFSSVSVVESFLLRLLCLIKMKKALFLMVDETFPAIDDGYIENTSKLIRELCDRLKLDVLAVSHIKGLSESAHRTYKLSLKKHELQMERIK